MKLDATKLPIGEMIIGFLLLVLAVTFVGAFAATDNDAGEDGAVSASPTAAPSPGAGTPTPSGGGGTLAVSMGDNFFELDGQKNPDIKLKTGQAVTINLTNKGTAIHNMRVDGEDGKYNSKDDAVSDPQLVSAGQTATLKWTAPDKAGSFKYQCDFHPTDMKGTITVE